MLETAGLLSKPVCHTASTMKYSSYNHLMFGSKTCRHGICGISSKPSLHKKVCESKPILCMTHNAKVGNSSLPRPVISGHAKSHGIHSLGESIGQQLMLGVLFFSGFQLQECYTAQKLQYTVPGPIHQLNQNPTTNCKMEHMVSRPGLGQQHSHPQYL